MVSVLVIGMGKFGRMLVEKLNEMGDELMIVDKKEDVINMMAAKYQNALIANCTNIESLRSMDIPSFDVCVVAIGEDFQSSLEITSNLKDLKAKRVVSKAVTEIQRKFLLRAGADEVIFPDQDMAERLAVQLNATNVVNYIDLDSDYSIFEIAVPKKWVNKKLIDVNPRVKHGMNILAVKKGTEFIATIDGNYVFELGDIVVVFGNTEQILKFTNKKK